MVSNLVLLKIMRENIGVLETSQIDPLFAKTYVQEVILKIRSIKKEDLCRELQL